MIRTKNKGFSLMEMVVVIAILAILAALIVPVLIQYTENSRAQKDVSTMDEVVNAVQLAMADPNCFDEMVLYACDNNFLTYSDSSGKYGQQTIDAEYWAPDGCGRGVTITFNPEKDSQGDTVYRLENAIVNDMTYGNGSVADNRQIIGSELLSNQCLLPNAKLSDGQDSGYLYNKIRQIVGNSVITTSATYSNSSFTIFIRFTQKDGVTVADVNGSFNGTNLDDSSQAALGSGTNTEVINPETGEKEPGQASKPSGGTTTVNYTNSALGGSGNATLTGSKDYVSNNNAPTSIKGTLSYTLLGEYVTQKSPKSIIFITGKASSGTDVSQEKNGSILAWVDGEICYVANTESNSKVYAGSSHISFSGETFAGYKDVEYISLGALDTKDITSLRYAFSHFGTNVTDEFQIDGLESWNTNKITDMAGTFTAVGHQAQKFKMNISNFNVASVQTMAYTFYKCGENATDFSIGDVSKWDISKCSNIEYMFCNCGSNATMFDIGDLSGWKTDNVTTMMMTFAYSGRLTQSYNLGNLNNWNTSKVTNMYGMFAGAGSQSTSWNVGHLDNWNTSNVTNMSHMFSTANSANAPYLGNLSNWDTSNVTNMSSMFANFGQCASNVVLEGISQWNVSNVTDMRAMFVSVGSEDKDFSIDLSKWDTGKVTDMSYMFYCTGLKSENVSLGNLSNWNVSSVQNMFRMFCHYGRDAKTWYLGDLSDWDTSSCTNMAHLFGSTARDHLTSVKHIGDLSNWDVSHVTSMRGMFHYAEFDNIGDISGWDTSNVHDMAYMFDYTNFTSPIALDLSNWNVSKTVRYSYFNTYLEIQFPNWVNELIGDNEKLDVDVDSNGVQKDTY